MDGSIRPAHAKNMKRVKTDWRNRLADPTLNDLMTVLLLSPEVESFDPVPSIVKSNADSKAKRKPGYKRMKKEKEVRLHVDDSSSDTDNHEDEIEEEQPMAVGEDEEKEEEKREEAEANLEEGYLDLPRIHEGHDFEMDSISQCFFNRISRFSELNHVTVEYLLSIMSSQLALAFSFMLCCVC